MRRLLALLSLSLAIVPSAFADEKGFAKALADWQALYRPLTLPQSHQTLVEVASRVERENALRREAITKADDPSIPNSTEWEDQAVEANVDALTKGYEQADARGKRVLVRLAAMLGSLFDDSDAPRYPTCGNEPRTVEVSAKYRLQQWVEKSPRTYLGLLDDPDARVAEAAVRVLHEEFPGEVTLRLEAWRRSPQTRFRGIVGQWASLLGEEAGTCYLIRCLDDPSDDIRDLAAADLPYAAVEEAYRLRRPQFETATGAQKRTILALAGRVDAPDILKLAVACLESDLSSLRLAALEVLHYKYEDATVPPRTLAKLRKDPTWDVQMEAYYQSGRQHIPMRDLRDGLTHPEETIRLAALEACCEGVETRAEFQFLLAYSLKHGWTSDLPDAARRLGPSVTEDVLPFLNSQSPTMRCLGIEMACNIPSPRFILALEKLLGDPDPEVRKTLANEVQRLPEETARRWLKLLANDPVEKVRDAVRSTIEALDHRDE